MAHARSNTGAGGEHGGRCTGRAVVGFDTAVIAGAIDTLRQTFHLSASTLGLTVSSALWGTVVGALAAGMPADRYGRRATLILCGLLYVLSALGCLLARSWLEVVVARFVGGLGIGASSVAGPMYIAEIAPPGWRGRLVGLFQINIVVGILLAYVSNYLLGRLLTGPEAVALETGEPRAACAAVFAVPAVDPAEPALAGGGREDRAGAACA